MTFDFDGHQSFESLRVKMSLLNSVHCRFQSTRRRGGGFIGRQPNISSAETAQLVKKKKKAQYYHNPPKTISIC